MSAQTSIEWTDRTWNPVRGCTRVSEGCRNCYAERMAARGFSWSKGFAKMTPAGPRWTGKVALVPEALDAPLRWRKPRRVFVNSMSDLFHESLPFADIACIYAVMAQAKRHTFQVLTKRPQRRVEFVSWLLRTDGVRVGGGLPDRWPLPNLWEGVSVEDQATADERIPLLLQTPAAIRFVSYEPALGPVDFSAWFATWRCDGCGWWDDDETGPAFSMSTDPTPYCPRCEEDIGSSAMLDWVIVGGESGPGARPFDLAWARDVVAQCKAAGVACFVKQLGARPTNSAQPDGDLVQAYIRDRKGGDMSEWPEDLRVREFPA